MRFVLAVGGTRTAGVEGISAAGANADLMAHTPSADAEIVEYGRPLGAPTVPVSPTGCPTPAVVTRAVRELLGFDASYLDAGLAAPTMAPAVDVGNGPGDDVRSRDPVPAAGDVFEAARRYGRALPDDEVVVAETIPGGTTTALGALTALGEEGTVSSSFPENPLGLKREVVEEALAASDLSPGEAAGDPLRAIRRVGDPVQAAVVGATVGCVERGAEVTLAGGTQMLAAAALVRHDGVDAPLSVATTSFVAGDDSADVRPLAAALDVDLVVTDPGFDAADHVSMERFVAGEAKEGVGMGGALALATRSEVSMAAVRDQVRTVYDRLLDGGGARRVRESPPGGE